ncbi:hypothetical protein G0U57_001130, partial [Chelydra serpentina]
HELGRDVCGFDPPFQSRMGTGALPASPLPGDGCGRLPLRAKAERSSGRARLSHGDPGPAGRGPRRGASGLGEMSDRKAAGKAAAQKGSKPASLVKKSGTPSRKPALGQQAERKGTAKQESSSKLPRTSSNKQNEPALINSP